MEKPSFYEDLLKKFDVKDRQGEAMARALIDSQAHLRTLIETIPDLVWLKDPEGVFLACNKKFERLYGASEREIIGKTDYDFVNSAQADFFREHDKRAIENGQAMKNEEEVTFLDDGHRELLETIKTPMYDAEGVLIGVLGVARDITERKRIEKELALSEKRLQASLKIANIGVWDWNTTEDTWYASPVYYTMLGYKPVSGPSDRGKWLRRIHPDDREMVRKKIHSILDYNTKAYRYEARMKHADGTYRWHLVIGHVLKRDKDRKPSHLIGLRIDTTERKKTELALAARQREFELLYRVSEIKLKEISLREMLKAIVREISKALDFPAVSIAYYREAEQELVLAATTESPLMHEKAPMRIPVRETPSGIAARTGQPLIEPCVSKRSGYGFDTLAACGVNTFVGLPMFVGKEMIGVLSMASPRRLIFETYMVPMARNLANHIASLIRHKRDAEELRLNHRRTRALLRLGQMAEDDLGEITDFALEALVDLTRSQIGYLGFLNEDETMLTIHSWSRSAIRDCRIQDVTREFSVADTGLWGETIRQRQPVVTNDYAAKSPFKKGLPEGHIPLHRHMGVPVIIREKIVAMAGVANKEEAYTETDIHQVSLILQGMWQLVERKRAAEEREKLQAQLVQAQKMEAVGRLAGGVAHDFNNMLGVIIGQADLVLSRTDPDENKYLFSALNGIRRAADRSADLTRQLLAFARRQPIAPKILNLNTVVGLMTKMLQRLIGEDIHLRWLPSENIYPVKMDPGQVDQILANLCVNARDAIEGQGQVTIETRNVHFDAQYCNDHAGFIPGAYVMLAVSDSGAGMEKPILDNIFEPFFSTKPVGKGTGLGLAMVYGIVKQNKGFINVYSEPGHGSCFKIYLPRQAGGKGEGQADVQEDMNPVPRGTETILVVEDHVEILRITQAMLEAQGYKVRTASSPEEALHLADREGSPPALLITDVIMPEMNGRELSYALTSRYPDLKVLFMSGYTTNVIAHHGVMDEGINFIQKPFSARDLAAKIRAILDRGF